MERGKEDGLPGRCPLGRRVANQAGVVDQNLRQKGREDARWRRGRGSEGELGPKGGAGRDAEDKGERGEEEDRG
jgi:hypothetical protein